MSRSNGAIALARTGKTHGEIAALMGVTRSAVSSWIAGTKKPTPEKRNRLLELFNIALDAWERRDRSQFSSVHHSRVATDATATVASAVSSVAEPVSSDTSPAAQVGARVAALIRPRVPDGVIPKAVELESMAHDLMTKLHNDEIATPLEQAKVMASCAATLTHLAKLTGQYDVDRRIFRLPVWGRIRKALAAGLQKHPEAAKAVEDELRLLEEAYDQAA